MRKLLIYLFINLLMISFWGCEKDPEPLPPDPEPDSESESEPPPTPPLSQGETEGESESEPEEEPEPDCETNDDCFSAGCIASECRDGHCFAELRNDLCLPDQKCDAVLGCVRDPNYSPSGECRSDADCGDGVDCTRDICSLATRRCARIPTHSSCPRDYVCDMFRGCIQSPGF